MFFETPRAHWICAICAGFHVYLYYQQKYCHLYHQKVVDFDATDLDDWQNHCWGLPLSMFAAASIHWAYVLGYVPWYASVIAFFAALTVYIILLRVVYCFAPPDYIGISREEYTEVRRHYGYDWFNTNPIYVLFSHYFRGGSWKKSPLQMHGGEPLVYFQHGKEYQQGGEWLEDELHSSPRRFTKE